jgi:hypothetical protein
MSGKVGERDGRRGACGFEGGGLSCDLPADVSGEARRVLQISKSEAGRKNRENRANELLKTEIL